LCESPHLADSDLRGAGRRTSAALPGGLFHEPTYSEKTLVAADAKAAIGALAAELASDGDAIIVGAGTTTQAFAAGLTRHTELTVVTNSLLVATGFVQPLIELVDIFAVLTDKFRL
jgi:DeoR/GlpR family transcriptional regulator of sugar metabolism